MILSTINKKMNRLHFIKTKKKSGPSFGLQNRNKSTFILTIPKILKKYPKVQLLNVKFSNVQ